MKWKTITNAGNIFIQNDLPGGPGRNNTSEFLQETAKQFARNCSNYFYMVDDLAFTYKERQIHAMLLPAIAKVSDAAFIEQPVTRKEGGHGWVDYWVYRDPLAFLIELKYGVQAVKQSTIRTTTKRDWRNAMEQIKGIRKSESKNIWQDTNNTRKIAMMIVLYFQSSRNEENLSPLGKGDVDFNGMHEVMMKNLSPTPNWSCLWLLHEKLQVINKFRNSHEIYPAVGIFAKVIPL